MEKGKGLHGNSAAIYRWKEGLPLLHQPQRTTMALNGINIVGMDDDMDAHGCYDGGGNGYGDVGDGDDGGMGGHGCHANTDGQM